MKYLRALCHSAISLLAMALWGLLYLISLPCALRPERRLARRAGRPAQRDSEYWRRRCLFFETQCYQLARMHREYRDRHHADDSHSADWWKRVPPSGNAPSFDPSDTSDPSDS